ncbi:MAG TPA: C39 family peptidase [Terriglobia bacterium]|nr:C39 family peptidase [Terriglobia bacterium]
MRAMRGAAAILLLALLAVALGAAATGIYLDVPYIRQPKNGCGAACLAMILQYWKNHDQAFQSTRTDQVAPIQRALYSKQEHGIYARDMVRYLDQSGMRAFAFTGGWSDLEEHLAKGRPLIVCLKEPGWRGPRHYVVVTGVDSGRQHVLLNDPARGKLTAVKWSEFQKDWKAAGSWTLLAVPRQGQ